ncbi:MAG: hypothetical protein ABSE73_01905 [Planctomycetota bacterium]
MRTALVPLVALVLLAAPLRGLAGETEASVFQPVVTERDLDFSACALVVNGQPVAGELKGAVLGALGLSQKGGWIGGQATGKEQPDNFVYLVVFKKPVPVGSMLCTPEGEWRTLKSGAPLPPDANKEAQWESVAFAPNQAGMRLATFPPGFQTGAFLHKDARQYGRSELRDWRLFAARLYNIAPQGLANADSDYTSFGGGGNPPVSFAASQLVSGFGHWQSHGPNEHGKFVGRAPISDVTPSWLVISWDKPQTIRGVYLRDNFLDFKLLAYRGAEGVNPAVGSDQDWKPAKPAVQGGPAGHWLALPRLETRGLKFLVLKTEQPLYATMFSLLVFSDLQEQPVPAGEAALAEPPLKIPLKIAEDGILSFAIDDPQGRRLRTLRARAECKAGELSVAWDLKDEEGRVVAPGKYLWKALTHPGLTLRYEMTPYPNIGDNAPENSPWLNGASGPGGWLADHAPPIAACAAGEHVFLSSPCAESGVAVIECDLNGRKFWGHHNLMAWTGPFLMASDGQYMFAVAWGDTDHVWRFELPGKKLDTFLEAPSTPLRQRGIRGVAARDGKVYLGIAGVGNWLDKAAFAEDVDIEHCEPHYPKPPKWEDANRPPPELRDDFLRLFRLMGTPAGGWGLDRLETAKDPGPRQHIVLTFNRAVPIGSLAFPIPEDQALHTRLSVLKPGAPYPPQSGKEQDWNVIWKSALALPSPQGGEGGVRGGWAVATAPENTVTRALRISFDRGMDELDELLEAGGGATPDSVLKDKGGADGGKGAWHAQLEGLRILRRRFANLASTAKVSVSSGQISKNGEWDAQRDKPITTADPGIYMLEWGAPQSLRGLAIEEIDGKLTEIDAYTGPDGGPVEMRNDKQWEKIARYEQVLRFYYSGGQTFNPKARYMDGYVDFGKEVKTRALRLRVVEQWTWREEDRAGAVGVRLDRGGQVLDPARCRIYGVAPLQYLGGEAPVDPLVTERLEIYDAREKKLLKELPLEKAGNLAFNPAGELHALSGAQVVKVDLQTGRRTPLVSDLQEPRGLAFDRSGNVYVFDGAAERRVIRVYDPAGKFLRTIGTPGGRVAGPWDPARFCSHPGVGVDLAIDARDQLWVVECDYTPKRISLWGTDGSFKKDFFGNTSYGGGGVLDPYDKKRLFYGPMEFELDWQTGKTRLKSMTWLCETPWARPENQQAGEVPIRVQGRTYLVSRGGGGGTDQSCGVVYLDEKDRVRRVAAVGMAGRFPALRQPDVMASLGRRPLGDLAFIWVDRNGDGKPQADEVTFLDDPTPVAEFDETLGVSAGAWRYEVKEFLPNGAPVYERKKIPGGRRGETSYRLANGSLFFIGDKGVDYAISATGEKVWSYPAGGRGVALNTAQPWHPGQVASEFDIIGHATAHAGDLGEFFVTNSNCGIWHVWTADGFLAGQIFRDLRGPGPRPWSMLEHARGMDLTDVTAGQEHFAGYFCRTLEDNKYYAVAGHNFTGVVEVQGFDKFKRQQGELNITAQEVAAAQEWNRRAQQRKIYEAAKILECYRAPDNIKVESEPKGWDFESAHLKDRNVSLALAYDDQNLYLCCKAFYCGPLKNTGNDWHRLFKTGAAVDLQLGVNPAAPLDRKELLPGDLRLLMTFVNGQPFAVLYQPNCPGAKPGEGWEARTITGHVVFDRVAQLEGVKMAMQQNLNSYCLEAAIPLAGIGLKIVPGLRLKLDWGILTSGPEGSEVLQRLYWANASTNIIADEPTEAQLHPGLWGLVRFSGASGKAGRQEDLRPDKMLKRDVDLDKLKLEDE